jgi:hypothetical protein
VLHCHVAEAGKQLRTSAANSCLCILQWFGTALLQRLMLLSWPLQLVRFHST